MSVSSYLELYLAVFGWYMFDEIWEVLKATGIAYLPFIGMFIRNIAAPIKSQEAKDAAGTSLRRIEVDLVAMMTVIVLAAQPIITLNFAGLNYVKACEPGLSPVSVKAGATGTSYDTTFTTVALGGGTAKVPVWWYGVLAITGGINNAIIVRIPCDTADIRLVKYELKNSRVKTPRLRREVQKFFNDCYAPAMSAYMENKNNKYTPVPANEIDDLYWIGSKYLVENIYPDYRSKTQIEGFVFKANRDLEYDATVAPLPAYGEPVCKEWWDEGLKDRLKGQINVDGMARLKTLVSTADKAETIALRALIENDKQNFKKLERVNPYDNSSFGNDLSGIAAGVGGVLESASFFPKMYLLKMAAPIIQAMILMMTYLLLPFILVFSSYKPGTMIFMSIVIFSIKFWTVLWAVAHWLDNHLLVALRPNGGLDLGYFIYENGLLDTSLVELVINFTTAIMFVVFPLFWTGALSWAGFEVGKSLNSSVSQMRGSSESAGNKGGDYVTKKSKV